MYTRYGYSGTLNIKTKTYLCINVDLYSNP